LRGHPYCEESMAIGRMAACSGLKPAASMLPTLMLAFMLFARAILRGVHGMISLKFRR